MQMVAAVPQADFVDQNGVWYPAAAPALQAGPIMLPAPGVPGGRVPVSPPPPSVERVYGGKGGHATMAVAVRETAPPRNNDEIITPGELDFCSGIVP